MIKAEGGICRHGVQKDGMPSRAPPPELVPIRDEQEAALPVDHKRSHQRHALDRMQLATAVETLEAFLPITDQDRTRGIERQPWFHAQAVCHPHGLPTIGRDAQDGARQAARMSPLPGSITSPLTPATLDWAARTRKGARPGTIRMIRPLFPSATNTLPF